MLQNSQFSTLNSQLPCSLRAVDKGCFVDGTLQLAALDGDQLVGCIDLYNYDPIHRRAEVGIVIDKAFRRQGYAHAALQALDILCRDTLKLHQLYCDIVASHTTSLHLFESNGYVRIGCMREWVQVGETYQDVIRYQKILFRDRRPVTGDTIQVTSHGSKVTN